MSTAVAVRLCSEDGCQNRIIARGKCKKHYERWRCSLPGHRVGVPDRPEVADKIAYLGSLTFGELAAYCSGVLARASIAGGDPDEIATWTELVRLTALRASD